MDVDSTTYNDLALFLHEEEFSVFHKLNFTKTAEGRDWLLKFFKTPFTDLRLIRETQEIIKLIMAKSGQWPENISNGTLMVIIRFYETALTGLPTEDYLNSWSYKIFHAPDFGLIRYSIGHFADFLRGIKQLTGLLINEKTPGMLGRLLERARDLYSRDAAQELASFERGHEYTVKEVIRYGRFLKHSYHSQAIELIAIYGRLDAWYSMAMAGKNFDLCFPDFLESGPPSINARQLYHVLLPQPVPYDIDLNIESNFIFLTGANMAGKSTFIKAIGTSVFLAHLGMGVPARSMSLTVFDGLLSNINVVDNLSKGESFFFNEVQRIKNTIVKINNERKWLVLIDELFKGTNVQDAMKCSIAVIRGLIRISNSLFILSTHLYEISDDLRDFPNISFKYFETEVKDEQLDFSYQLKEGVSNDRIGYVILKREKVVEMLEKL
jgi:DNA mismatch repair protein MutS